MPFMGSPPKIETRVRGRIMRAVVTGGAGFLGSFLCDALVSRSDSVVCIDNLITGRLENIRELLDNPAFDFIGADVSAEWDVEGVVDVVAHLASPAAPADYLAHPLGTLEAGSRGTEKALRLARRKGARFILASSSEVYGDPLVHPQPEEYWGNVNPIGPRSVYDEAKRFAEALTTASRGTGVNTGIVRIFNTYGPRMSTNDGRIAVNFITQALTGAPLTIYGDGSQTRSLCYVDDLIQGILAMIDSAEQGPINLGNPEELSVSAFADLVLRITGSSSPIVYQSLPQDDPCRRCPQISRAETILHWHPNINLEDGIRRTAAWYSDKLDGVLEVR
jgi:dTDP-glucose 4,6-dehydratase